MSGKEYPTTEHLDSPVSDFQAHQFMVEQAISRISKMIPVQITKVSTSGQVGAAGTVSVTPLVKMQDALGNVHAHGNMSNLPYFRMQGGADKAIIMDPKVGDIGFVVFADRDISAAKKNNKSWDGKKKASEAQSPPGSFRQHDMADGVYVGSMLGGTPKSYFQFMDDGTLVLSPDEGNTFAKIEKDKIILNVSGMLVQITKTRVDLGGTGGDAVVTVGGPSSIVFAKL